MTSKLTIPKELIADFSHFLTSSMGLDFPKERWSYLEKKLLVIMLDLDFQEPKDFIQWLQQHPSNQDAIDVLAHHLTIGETYFFRDSHTFAILRKNVLPDIIQRHQHDRTIRIWCAASCSGEEPYSIAITLHQLLPDFKNWNLTILGSDINVGFLKKAEKARYKKWSFRATPVDIMEKYFIKHHDSTYTLIPEIQQRVKFSYLNLVESNYPTDLDLIMCHNVLIYFTQSQIKKIIHKFSHSLKELGWLSVTAIEAPFVSDATLVPLSFDKALFFRKQQKSQPVKEEFKSSVAPPKKTKKPLIQLPELIVEPSIPKVVPKKKEMSVYEQALELSHAKHYGEVISLLSSFLQPFRKHPQELLKHLNEISLLVHTYANQGNFIEALKWCQTALEADKLDPLLNYLYATLLHSSGDSEGAVRFLKQTLFLDPQFVMAHYMMGLLEQTRNKKTASRHFKIAWELVQDRPSDDIVPGTDELTIERLKDLLSSLQGGG